jgi:hypothetical protein
MKAKTALLLLVGDSINYFPPSASRARSFPT